MVLSVTTSRVTSEQARQVEAFLHGFLPRLKQEQGVVAVYHFSRPEPHESTTLIVWESDEARQAYRQGDLIKEAMAFEQRFDLASTRDAYPLTYASTATRADARAVAKRWVEAMTAHDLDAAVACFAPDYHDEAPARRGEVIQGNEKVRENFAALFQNVPDLRAELLRSALDGDTVWMEWRMHGTRRDGTPMEFAGVNLFGVRDGQFVWGRIYTELVRDAGGIDAQIECMSKG